MTTHHYKKPIQGQNSGIERQKGEKAGHENHPEAS
jgi:hypothetical protein